MKGRLVFQSDFGLADGAVAAMYGVALSVDPDLRIYNLTHDIPPFDTFEASYRLLQAVPFWPENTYFVTVVDPGVGSSRRSIVALTKGGKLLYEVAGLDKPEDKHADMNRISFLPSVVVTNVKEVDPDKEYIDDEETKRIAAKYGAYIPEQRIMVEKQVATMEARAGIGYSADDNDDHNDNEYGDEQDRQ